jgi:membrane associated rhomboid family serine protease
MIPIPVGDINPRRTTPVVNYLLIVANVAAYLWVFYFAPRTQANEIMVTSLLVPRDWMNLKTIFTSMFLHASLLHLMGNMLFLWIAGDNVEDRLGHLTYLVFYLLCGLAGAAAHIVMALGPMSSMAAVPTLGASGAISGVLGAYLVFFPRSKIKFMIWLILFIRYFTLPSWGAIGFWIVEQILMARQQFEGNAPREQMTVAVFAHLGGFAFGMVWAILVRLFGKAPPKPSRD